MARKSPKARAGQTSLELLVPRRIVPRINKAQSFMAAHYIKECRDVLRRARDADG